MEQRTKVSGVARKIIGGRIRNAGVGYDLTDSKTKVDGVAYTVKFDDWLADFVALMQDATIQTDAGRNNSKTGSVSATGVANRYYFVFCDGEFSVYRWDGSALVQLYASASNKALLCQIYGTNFALSNNGAQSATVYGGTIIGIDFANYTTAEADEILSGLTKVASAGRNSASTAAVSLTCDAGATILAAYSTAMGLSSPIGTVILGNNTNNQSLIRYSGGAASISADGSANTAVYGGSVIQLA